MEPVCYETGAGAMSVWFVFLLTAVRYLQWTDRMVAYIRQHWPEDWLDLDHTIKFNPERPARAITWLILFNANRGRSDSTFCRMLNVIRILAGVCVASLVLGIFMFAKTYELCTTYM